MTTPRLPDAPTLRIGALDWQRDAACAGEDLALFFGAEGERGFERALRERAVKRICARCPVREQCLQHALDTPEKYGLWGGLNEEERAVERRRRKRRVHPKPLPPVVLEPQHRPQPPSKDVSDGYYGMGRCESCGYSQRLTKTGLVISHRPKGTTVECPGTGRPPMTGVEEAVAS